MADLNVDQNAMTQAATGSAPSEPAAATETTPSMTELDGLSEFTFQGEKYTPDQLHKLMSEHKTYSQEMKGYEQKKTFEKNLKIDLNSVSEDPRLADDFKRMYPQEYHALVDIVLKNRQQSQPAPSVPAQTNALPKEFLNEFGELKQGFSMLQAELMDAKTAEANAKLDTILPPLAAKFPMAVEDQVLQRAEGLLKSGQRLTEKTWERLYRESHDSLTKRADQFYSAKLKSQLEKGQKGADSGSGGAAPGQAPVKEKKMGNNFQGITSGLATLKNFYQGPIVDQFSEDLAVWRGAEKGKYPFSGQQVIRPLKVRRNPGVGATSDGGILPAIGRQT
ncbi:MAG: hypothetical protein V4440_12510, partial [Pseudomonadota bacterium]